MRSAIVRVNQPLPDVPYLDDSYIDTHDRPWVIIGAGPVGSMMAAMLSTLFPERTIHVFDKYYANIRGHGLDIHAQTVDDIKHILQNLKKFIAKQAYTTVQDKKLQKIEERIDDFIKHLEKEVSGKFIKTYQISKNFQNYCKLIGKDTVHFHLESEITADDMAVISDNSLPATNEKQQILKSSRLIFGADGSHSNVRRVLFDETNDDLLKDNLSYLLEIKLDMNDKSNANKYLDKLNRSIIPTIKTGRLHIWNQSADGTATLHIFINQEMYDLLHVSLTDKKGAYKGTFAHPYRRLVDLPDQVKQGIERIIVDVIDQNHMDASTLKVTTIPMHVYKARQLVKLIGNKRVMLVGDSGVGLVLARGVNNGFYATAEYAASLYKEYAGGHTLEKINDFVQQQAFLDSQHEKFNQLINLINRRYPLQDETQSVKRQLAILTEYTTIHDEIINSFTINSKLSSLKLNKTLDEYIQDYKQIVIAIVCGNTDFDENVANCAGVLLEDLTKEKLGKLAVSHLHKCQNKLFKRADNKIADAKFEISLMDSATKIFDFSSSSSESISSFSSSSSCGSVSKGFYEAKPNYFSNLSSWQIDLVKENLQKLHARISQYNLSKNPDYAKFVFLVDRMYLAIENRAREIDNREVNMIIKYINDAIRFLNNLESGVNEKIETLYKPWVVSHRLLNDISDVANYLFNPRRIMIRKLDNRQLIDLAIRGIENYLKFYHPNISTYEKWFGIDDVDQAKHYLTLLYNSIKEINPTVNLVILYALFKNTELKHLRQTVYDVIVNAEKQAQYADNDIQVMCEELQNRILESTGVHQIQLFADIAKDLLEMINTKKLPAYEIVTFKKMLAQIDEFKYLDPSKIVNIASEAIREYSDSRSDIIYSPPQQGLFSLVNNVQHTVEVALLPVLPECMKIFQDSRINSCVKLAILHAILSTSRPSTVQKHLIAAFGSHLQSDLIMELIENHIREHGSIPQDKWSELSSSLDFLKRKMEKNGDIVEADLKSLQVLISMDEIASRNESVVRFRNLVDI